MVVDFCTPLSQTTDEYLCTFCDLLLNGAVCNTADTSLTVHRALQLLSSGLSATVADCTGFCSLSTPPGTQTAAWRRQTSRRQ